VTSFHTRDGLKVRFSDDAPKEAYLVYYYYYYYYYYY